MKIPFFKAHGARNDFLLTWSGDAPAGDRRVFARAICDRHSGVGADGWMLVTRHDPSSDAHATIQLFNSDGSDSEISGNGTRCAAALLLDSGLDSPTVRLATGAGSKHLELVERCQRRYFFRMNMGNPKVEELRTDLNIGGVALDASILNVGNPQCAVLVDVFPEDWRSLGAQIEHHPRFPNRTNVSFLRVLDPQTIDVLFWERGAGETMSSGTGSTGAAAAAMLRGLVQSPVEVRTPAGTLPVCWDSDDIYLTGPAEIVAGGEYYLPSAGK